jgi:hypothetical protein
LLAGPGGLTDFSITAISRDHGDFGDPCNALLLLVGEKS